MSTPYRLNVALGYLTFHSDRCSAPVAVQQAQDLVRDHGVSRVAIVLADGPRSVPEVLGEVREIQGPEGPEIQGIPRGSAVALNEILLRSTDFDRMTPDEIKAWIDPRDWRIDLLDPRLVYFNLIHGLVRAATNPGAPATPEPEPPRRPRESPGADLADLKSLLESVLIWTQPLPGPTLASVLLAIRQVDPAPAPVLDGLHPTGTFGGVRVIVSHVLPPGSFLPMDRATYAISQDDYLANARIRLSLVPDPTPDKETPP